MSWWLATFGAQKDAYQAASASAAQARHPTWTIAGPYASRAAALGQAPSAPPATGSPGSTGGCGAQAIYQALLTAGFSTVQAVGAMANAIAESTLNPEANVMDSNGYRSYGLWQFNAQSYPNAASLVTGNCSRDITSQVAFLKSVVSGAALNGSTGAEVAGNFAANFERCQGCSAGSTATNGWSTRVGNAATVQGWIASGNWPTSAAGLSGSGAGGATLASSSTRCLVGGNTFIPCLLDASQARGIIGGLCLAVGGVLFLGGVVLMVGITAIRSDVGTMLPGPVGAVARAGKGAAPPAAPKAPPAPKPPPAPRPAPRPRPVQATATVRRPPPPPRPAASASPPRKVVQGRVVSRREITA